MNRAGKPPGKALQWQFNAKTGAVTQKSGKGGIDWWRYQREILLKKLIPFALECKKDRPGTVVQEDKALSHASKHQRQIFLDANICRLLWPGNSLDLNAIEPCWMWMK